MILLGVSQAANDIVRTARMEMPELDFRSCAIDVFNTDACPNFQLRNNIKNYSLEEATSRDSFGSTFGAKVIKSPILLRESTRLCKFGDVVRQWTTTNPLVAGGLGGL